MAELRRSFWGKSWERAPSSKERRTKMYRMLQRAHCGKDHIKFFKFSYIIESEQMLYDLIPSFTYLLLHDLIPSFSVRW
jgi:hypothetical protein